MRTQALFAFFCLGILGTVAQDQGCAANNEGGSDVDLAYTECALMIPGAEDMTVNGNEDVDLACDPKLGESLVNVDCYWLLPSGDRCSPPDPGIGPGDGEDASCSDPAVRFVGSKPNGNCNIRVEEIDRLKHNGTWKCFVDWGTPNFVDSVNITVSSLTQEAKLGLAIGIPVAVIVIIIIVIILICCLCPQICRREKQEKVRPARAAQEPSPYPRERQSSRHTHTVQIVRTPQHVQQSTYPVYENSSDYDYSSSGSPTYDQPNVGGGGVGRTNAEYEPVVTYTRAIPTTNQSGTATRTATRVSNVNVRT